MDWERLPVVPLHADVRAYCSHVKMCCKRARLLSSHPRLFIHSFIRLGKTDKTSWTNLIHFMRRRIVDFYCIGGFELNSSELNSTIARLINRALNQSFLYCLSSEIVLLICKPNSSFELHGQTSSTACGRLLVFGRLTREKFNMQNFSSVALRLAHA